MYSNGIKAFIIESISEKVFLNAKQIIFLVSENFDHNNSDKTVYRHLKDLLKDDILMKYGEYYKFSMSYIEKIQRLNNNIQNNIFNIQHGQEILEDIKKGPIENYFASFIEIVNFINNLTKTIRLKEKKELKQYFFFYHRYHIFTNDGKKILNISKLNKNHNVTGCICGKTKFDDFTVKKLTDIGFDIKLVIKENIYEKNSEYYILGNYIYSIKYSNDFIDKENNLISQCKNGILTKKIIDFMNGKKRENKVYLKIEYNEKKAKKLTKLILSCR